MLNRFLHPKSHYYIHFLVLALFSVGIVCSKALMSIGILLGLLNLLLEVNFNGIWLNLKQNRAFWLICGLFILHVIGLFWTTKLEEGLDDLRMKTSLVTVPLIVFSKANESLKLKEKILALVLTTICFISLINVLTYFQLFGFREYTDMRQLSLFGSHIRFSLLIAFGIALSLFYFDKSKKYGFLILVAYLIFYTLLSQVLTGFVALLVVFMAYGILKLRQNGFKWIAWTVLSIVGLVLILATISVFTPPKKSQLAVNELQLAVCWKKASTFDYFGKDKKNQPVSSTLIRYMHSKELSADSIGFLKLNKEDIEEIEKGTADIHEKTPGFIGKLYEARFQIHSTTNPNGSTIRQRLEYWKIGIQLIKENFILGVGSGDIKEEYQKKYTENNSRLLPENRLEAHNTFLTFFITFGIFGFLYLLYVIYDVTSKFYQRSDFLGFAFMLIMTSSFLTEDTLETQMGITIFSFLYSFVFLRKN
jgi:O-antigen ligase